MSADHTPPNPPTDPHAEPKAIAERLRRLDHLIRDESAHGSPRPAKVTAALPGTEEKLREMMARIARGESACHPDDLDVADLAALGYDFTVVGNGVVVWRRVLSEQDRRAEIEAAAARRREERGG